METSGFLGVFFKWRLQLNWPLREERGNRSPHCTPLRENMKLNQIMSCNNKNEEIWERNSSGQDVKAGNKYDFDCPVAPTSHDPPGDVVEPTSAGLLDFFFDIWHVCQLSLAILCFVWNVWEREHASPRAWERLPHNTGEFNLPSPRHGDRESEDESSALLCGPSQLPSLKGDWPHRSRWAATHRQWGCDAQRLIITCRRKATSRSGLRTQ